MNLDRRYGTIERRLRALPDFPVEELKKSRALFATRADRVTPRRFNVWTCLCGLPAPRPLTRRLRQAANDVAALLPAGTRAYWTAPATYHWELFIIKRPDERLSQARLREAAATLRAVLAEAPPFRILYRGLLVTPDGTVVARGYGEFDGLRRTLRERIAFASRRQSVLGHISLGRILDPIGPDRFAALKALVAESRDETYGLLPVRQAKYVHEHQWYMEDREIVGRFSLG